MAKGVNWERILRKAANSGKKAIIDHYDLETRRKVVKRGVGGDLTLKIDEVSERSIYNSLKSDLGKDSFVFLSEEIGEVPSEERNSLPIVVCDPLDGSHNAQAGIPFFSLALSVMQPASVEDGSRSFGSVIAAIIASIKTDDEYFATKGGGAFHNGTQLPKRRAITRLQTLLVETGDIDFLREKLLVNLTLDLVYKIRILGSAALSYCLLADGTADAFVFAQPGGARTIDSPAGYLIAREAGCVFADVSGKQKNIDNVKVGFESKINLLGAPDAKTLARLKKLVRVF